MNNWTPQEINPMTEEDLIKTFAIQTKTESQAQETIEAYKLTSVEFSDEDDTMFQADVTPAQLKALKQDSDIVYLSEI